MQRALNEFEAVVFLKTQELYQLQMKKMVITKCKVLLMIGPHTPVCTE
jgi:hypothetical protein